MFPIPSLFSAVGGLRITQANVNGQVFPTFQPNTAFNGATYTLETDQPSGVVWTSNNSNATVTDGVVTVLKRGIVSITATKVGVGTATHTINPTLWFYTDHTKAPYAEYASWLTSYGMRQPTTGEFAEGIPYGSTTRKVPSGLWSEWGDMKTYGWEGDATPPTYNFATQYQATQDPNNADYWLGYKLAGDDSPPTGSNGKCTSISKTNTNPFYRVGVYDPSAIKATSLTTDSIGIAIVGGKKQVTWTTNPENATIYGPLFTTSNPAIMTVDGTGLMTFVSEGSFSVTMTAKTGYQDDFTTLSDSSGEYASVLSVYTDSLPDMLVGGTQSLVATISPSGAATIPGMVITYTTTDASVATVDAGGLITGVAEGDCRIGCTATYQGTVTASDSSHLNVNDPGPTPITPSPHTTNTLLNAYMQQTSAGPLMFPAGFTTTEIVNGLTKYIIKIDDVQIPSTSANFTVQSGSTIRTVASYPAGNYRVYIEKVDSATVNTMAFRKSTSLLEAWGGNLVNFSTGSEFFNGCTNLRRVTADVFSNTINTATSLNSIFAGTAITDVPAGTLNTTSFPNLTTLGFTFQGSTSLTKPVTGFFGNHPNVTTYTGAFINCTGITTVPAGTFAAINTATTDLSQTFSGCTGLTNLDTIRADNPQIDVIGKIATRLTSFFKGCVNLVGDGTAFIAQLNNVNQSQIVSGDTLLTGYSLIPSKYK